MSFSWADADKQVAAIQTALSVETPDFERARRIVEALSKSVKARVAETSEVKRIFRTDELTKAARTLAFETWHFRCLTRIRREKLSPPPSTVSQAIGYALLVHIRVIASFFYSRSTSFTDCHIYHFNELPDFEAKFPAQRYERTEKTKRLLTALNQFLAHFSTTRWETDREPWPFYDGFTPTIEELIRQFEESLPEEMFRYYAEEYKRWERSNPVS